MKDATIEKPDVEPTPEVVATEAPATPVSKIKGKTLIVDGVSEFDRVTTPTLRAWKRYWSNEDRCKGDEAITEERSREEHIRLIDAELSARGK